MSASESQQLKELYEFGPFRVDPEKEILLRAGEPVPLTPKTFQILLVLVRHGQEVVTKDDLMKAVWPDTFVEEANLSRNIFMLRKALRESPQDHRYILTVPGRGYRFAENVRLVPEQQVSIFAAQHSTMQVHVKETTPWGWLSAWAGILLAIAVGATWLLLHRKPVLTERDTVVLAEFANSTGDPVFDGTIRQGLSIQLAQSPFLSLISDARIQHTLRLMDKPADTRLSPEIANEVCERTGSAAVLNGSIANLGSEYVLGLRAVNCHSGEVLDEEQVQALRKEDVLNALSRMAVNFRTRVGESIATVKQHNTALQDATTTSLEALKAYSLGWEVLHAQGPAAAVPFFKRAVEIDSEFAAAHATLALMYGHTGESALATQTIRRAHELRSRASDEERFFIDAYYQGRATGNMEKAQQTCEEWERTYPRDIRPHQFSAGFIDPGLARYEKAIQEGYDAIRLDPDEAITYELLGGDELFLNRFDEAENVLRYASDRKVDIPDFLTLRFDLAFLKNDESEMNRIAGLAQENSGAQDWVAHHQAFVYAYHGRMQEARRTSRQAAELAEQAAHSERSSLFETPPLLWEGFFGNASEAKRLASTVLERPHGRETEYGAALALALSGESSHSQALANDLEKQFPDDTSVRFSYLPTVRAVLALNHGDPLKAIDLLQTAVPYDLAVPRSSLQGFFGALYPVYIRGLAYLAAGNGARGADEFRKILDHRAIVRSDPIGALAHLQLAKAYAAVGDKAKAKSSYEDFLNLWKDADSDIPILKQANAEYARLQ